MCGLKEQQVDSNQNEEAAEGALQVFGMMDALKIDNAIFGAVNLAGWLMLRRWHPSEKG